MIIDNWDGYLENMEVAGILLAVIVLMSAFTISIVEEVFEWGRVFRQHWIRWVGSFAVLILLVVLFQLALVGLRLVDEVLSYVSSEVDILVDVAPGVSADRVSQVMGEIRMMDGVVGVTSLTSDEALEFVHAEVVPGYADFLKNNRLPNPFLALVRVQVRDASLFSSLKKRLLEAYPTVFVAEIAGSDKVVQSLSDQAVSFGLTVSTAAKWIALSVGGLVVVAYCFLLWGILQTRKHEFYLVTLVGLHHGFYRWSFWGMALVLSFSALFLGYILFWLVSGVVGLFFLWQFFGAVGFGVTVAELGYRF